MRIANRIHPSLRPRRKSTRTPTFTRPMVLTAIREWVSEHGEPVTINRWKASGARPSHTTIDELFRGTMEGYEGGWTAAVAAAGFTPLPRGHSDTLDEESAILQAMLDAGNVTLRDLADELGITPQALGRRLKRYREKTGHGTVPYRGWRKKRTPESALSDEQFIAALSRRRVA